MAGLGAPRVLFHRLSEPGRSRTCARPGRNRVLCPLSYRPKSEHGAAGSAFRTEVAVPSPCRKRPVGFEPTTSTLGRLRSAKLSYGRTLPHWEHPRESNPRARQRRISCGRTSGDVAATGCGTTAIKPPPCCRDTTERGGGDRTLASGLEDQHSDRLSYTPWDLLEDPDEQQDDDEQCYETATDVHDDPPWMVSHNIPVLMLDGTFMGVGGIEPPTFCVSSRRAPAAPHAQVRDRGRTAQSLTLTPALPPTTGAHRGASGRGALTRTLRRNCL